MSPSSSVPFKPQGVSSNLPFRPATPPVSEPSTYEEEDLGDINLDNFSNIEADREWYNIDEESALARDNEIDEDLPQRQRKRIRNTRHPKKHPRHHSMKVGHHSMNLVNISIMIINNL